MPNRIRYVIITPVRDEAQYVEKTMISVVRQTILPMEWIIVNDGSTDGTDIIIQKFLAPYNWIRLLERKNRGHRAAGGGVIEAFYDGYAAIRDSSWDFLVKLDGDLSFDADYFEKCFAHFASKSNLGIGGGTICSIQNGQLKVDSAGDPPFHVRGATKIYRHRCWEEISPLVKAPGWDTLDEIRAIMYGWTTQTFADLNLIQHKATGAADGSWQNWYKNGLANYICGYHAAFMIGKCLKRTFQKPFLVASAALWLGYCSGYVKRIPQVQDGAAICFLRRQQLRRLLMKPSIYG